MRNYRFLLPVLLSVLFMLPARIAFPQVPDTPVPVTSPVVEPAHETPAIPDSYKPDDIAAREASFQRGEVQSVNDWMSRPWGVYSFLSKNYPDRPGGIKLQVFNPAHLFSNQGISYYRFPILGYETTVPWTRVHSALGINLNAPPELLEAVCKRLKLMGVKYARIDAGFGNMRFDDPAQLKETTKQRLALVAATCKKYGIRLLVCCDTHPAEPCPMIEAQCTLVTDLNAGDTSAIITPRAGEKPVAMKSGFSHVANYWAAEWLWETVEQLPDGNWRVTFKPWTDRQDRQYRARSSIPCAYLAFRPFGDDGSALEKETYAGFQQYVGAVADFLASPELNLAKSKIDPGFDLEICNELSNWGFAHLGWYVAGKPNGDVGRVYRETVATIRSNPRFNGIRLINGFHNQSPFGAASSEPAGSSAGSSHFYRSAVKTPGGPASGVEDAFGRTMYWNAETNTVAPLAGWQPDLVVHAPETIFSGKVLENVVPQLSPVPFQMWGVVRGKGVQPREKPGDYSSPILKEPTGKLARGVEWDFTEWGDEVWHGTEAERDLWMSRYNLRGMVVFTGKGGGRLYWYAAMGARFGILSQSATVLPTKQRLAEVTMKRFMAALKGTRITKPRSIWCVSIAENHGQLQFKGNGTPAFPDLPNRDVLLPQAYQLGDGTFAVSLHIMDHDYKATLAPALYTIRWRGVRPSATSTYWYRDLLKTRSTTVTPSAVGPDWIEFTLPVGNTPQLLIMRNV